MRLVFYAGPVRLNKAEDLALVIGRVEALLLSA